MADADLVLLVLDAPTLAAAGSLAPEDLAIILSAGGTINTSTGLFHARERVENGRNYLLLALNKIDLLPNPLQISISDTVLSTESPAAHSPHPASDAVLSTEAPERSKGAEGAQWRDPRIGLSIEQPAPRTSNPTSNLEPRTSNLTTIPTSALTSAGIPELRAAIVAAVAGPRAASRESALLTNLRQHQSVAESLRALAAARAAVQNRIPHEMLLLDLYAALRALDSLTGATTSDDVLRLIFSTFCIGK
jgi:tRNA U34 5-carboxymethylaminomethyl modifying GTPase MnmE/TrmE